MKGASCGSFVDVLIVISRRDRYSVVAAHWTLRIMGSEFEKEMIGGTPLGRIGRPDDIARVAVSLTSDDSAWVTETYRDPVRVHAICEEYRAAASLDIEHDKTDQAVSRRITCPMLHLWSAGGPLDTFYEQDGGPLGIWRKWADHVQGEAVKGGHFFPEENPAETTEILTRFLSA